MSKNVVIIGGGLAGLSTAYHLKNEKYELFEKGDRVGGLCRSSKVDGFTFDFTGHLLHFRKKEIKNLVEGLLKNQLKGHGRASCVFSKGVFTPYPFQANTYGLPLEVVRECLLGYIETLVTKSQKREISRTGRNKNGSDLQPSFLDWIHETFGGGIARHFMVPFNEKLWKRPLHLLTSDWVSWLVPKPNLEDIVNGALGLRRRELGYNPSFFYPRHGGIESLPKRLGRDLKNIHLKEEVASVHTKKKYLTLVSGQRVDYDTLVSTMPLPEFISRCIDLPVSMKKAALGLEYVSIYNINLGIARKTISKKHWIYFPEKEYPFYRVGFPMNFSSSLVPKGMSSLYVEISHLPQESIPKKRLLKDAREGLIRSGVLSKKDEIIVSHLNDIHYAYVIFNPFRQKNLPSLLQNLAQRGIHSIGRYGAWEHTSMEDALSQGWETAKTILNGGKRKVR